MKNVFLAAGVIGLTALSTMANAATAGWTCSPWNGGTVYQATLSSPTITTAPLYGGAGSGLCYAGKMNINSLIGYVISPTGITLQASGTAPSITIVITRDVNAVATTAISTALVVKQPIASGVVYSSTPSSTFANNVGPIQGIQFTANHSVTDTEVVRVYELPSTGPVAPAVTR